jgi:regulator of replication initiation timing
MKDPDPVPPPREERSPSPENVAALRETIEELQSRNERLEAERDQLLEENRALRREMTQMRLLSDMEESIDAIEEETGHLPAAPPPAEDLYALLPPSFAFPVFFEVADSNGLDTAEARRCLLHFLAKDRVVQQGSRLVKRPG